jgi:hypothetical protein
MDTNEVVRQHLISMCQSYCIEYPQYDGKYQEYELAMLKKNYEYYSEFFPGGTLILAKIERGHEFPFEIDVTVALFRNKEDKEHPSHNVHDIGGFPLKDIHFITLPRDNDPRTYSKASVRDNEYARVLLNDARLAFESILGKTDRFDRTPAGIQDLIMQVTDWLKETQASLRSIDSDKAEWCYEKVGEMARETIYQLAVGTTSPDSVKGILNPERFLDSMEDEDRRR